jgi:succinate dehydrogenase/fumarate reductase iron-sulfur protein
MLYRLKVFRFDPEKDQAPYFRTYEVDLDPSTTILDTLKAIVAKIDSTIALRYSCREAVCGSCGMLINGAPNLACRVLLKHFDPAEEITVEPMANLEILKDLVVDMEPFWEAYAKIEPYIIPKEGRPIPEKEHSISEEEMEKIYQYISCVLCSCCYSACPVVGKNDQYLGPAALAKMYRYVRDQRDGRTYHSMKPADDQNGVWGCQNFFRCIDACPKAVRPVDGIEGMRWKLIGKRIRSFFGGGA